MTEKNVLPEPSKCDVCGSDKIKFVRNDEIYGQCFGDWPYAWLCLACSACVSCHKGTKNPLGRMANKQTRRLRHKAHDAFDPIWQSGLLSRTDAYNWLAERLNIEPADCHISWLTEEQLKATASYSREYLESRTIDLRRKAKKDAKRAKHVRNEIERRDRRKSNGQPRFSRRSR